MQVNSQPLSQTFLLRKSTLKSFEKTIDMMRPAIQKQEQLDDIMKELTKIYIDKLIILYEWKWDDEDTNEDLLNQRVVKLKEWGDIDEWDDEQYELTNDKEYIMDEFIEQYSKKQFQNLANIADVIFSLAREDLLAWEDLLALREYLEESEIDEHGLNKLLRNLNIIIDEKVTLREIYKEAVKEAASKAEEVAVLDAYEEAVKDIERDAEDRLMIKKSEYVYEKVRQRAITPKNYEISRANLVFKLKVKKRIENIIRWKAKVMSTGKRNKKKEESLQEESVQEESVQEESVHSLKYYNEAYEKLLKNGKSTKSDKECHEILEFGINTCYNIVKLDKYIATKGPEILKQMDLYLQYHLRSDDKDKNEHWIPFVKEIRDSLMIEKEIIEAVQERNAPIPSLQYLQNELQNKPNPDPRVVQSPDVQSLRQIINGDLSSLKIDELEERRACILEQLMCTDVIISKTDYHGTFPEETAENIQQGFTQLKDRKRRDKAIEFLKLNCEIIDENLQSTFEDYYFGEGGDEEQIFIEHDIALIQDFIFRLKEQQNSDGRGLTLHQKIFRMITNIQISVKKYQNAYANAKRHPTKENIKKETNMKQELMKLINLFQKNNNVWSFEEDTKFVTDSYEKMEEYRPWRTFDRGPKTKTNLQVKTLFQALKLQDDLNKSVVLQNFVDWANNTLTMVGNKIHEWINSSVEREIANSEFPPTIASMESYKIWQEAQRKLQDEFREKVIKRVQKDWSDAQKKAYEKQLRVTARKNAAARLVERRIKESENDANTQAKIDVTRRVEERRIKESENDANTQAKIDVTRRVEERRIKESENDVNTQARINATTRKKARKDQENKKTDGAQSRINATTRVEERKDEESKKTDGAQSRINATTRVEERKDEENNETDGAQTKIDEKLKEQQEEHKEQQDKSNNEFMKTIKAAEKLEKLKEKQEKAKKNDVKIKKVISNAKVLNKKSSDENWWKSAGNIVKVEAFKFVTGQVLKVGGKIVLKNIAPTTLESTLNQMNKLGNMSPADYKEGQKILSELQKSLGNDTGLDSLGTRSATAGMEYTVNQHTANFLTKLGDFVEKADLGRSLGNLGPEQAELVQDLFRDKTFAQITSQFINVGVTAEVDPFRGLSLETQGKIKEYVTRSMSQTTRSMSQTVDMVVTAANMGTSARETLKILPLDSDTADYVKILDDVVENPYIKEQCHQGEDGFGVCVSVNKHERVKNLVGKLKESQESVKTFETVEDYSFKALLGGIFLQVAGMGICLASAGTGSVVGAAMVAKGGAIAGLAGKANRGANVVKNVEGLHTIVVVKDLAEARLNELDSHVKIASKIIGQTRQIDKAYLTAKKYVRSQDVETIGKFRKARFDTLDFLKTLSTSEVPTKDEQLIIESQLGLNLEIMKDFYEKYAISPDGALVTLKK